MKIKLIKLFPAFWITVIIFVCIELGLRLIPIEYAAGAGVFLTNHHKNLAEKSEPVFDYIILGDSRSMSLMGHAPTAAEPYSMYNFSLPALGSRYFIFLLKKYLKNRKFKPAALIFAGDPGHFIRSYSNPYHDPQMLYSDSTKDSFTDYIYNRFFRRMKYALTGGVPRSIDTFRRNELIWETFSHRYLHLFNITEIFQQFTGAERIFILREAIPHLLQIYKYRDAIEHYTVGFRIDFLKRAKKLPQICRSCAGVLRKECHPDLPRVQDSLRLAEDLKMNYGQLNIINRLQPHQLMMVRMFREDAIKKAGRELQIDRVDLRELEDLIGNVTALGMKIILTELPVVEDNKNAKLYSLYRKAIKKIVKKYPGAKRISFPSSYYQRRYFAEHVHYECQGAEKLNKDFYESVMPHILKFAPPDTNPERIRIRGF